MSSGRILFLFTAVLIIVSVYGCTVIPKDEKDDDKKTNFNTGSSSSASSDSSSSDTLSSSSSSSISSSSSSSSSMASSSSSAEKTKVLIIVIENNDSFGSTALNLYWSNIFTHDIVASLLAQILEVNVSEITNKSLDDVIDDYAEDWQINKIKDIAVPHYDIIASFTDSSASYTAFLNELNKYKSAEYSVDVILNLHGDQDGIYFADRQYINISDLKNTFISQNISIRALYQTCCYGSYTIDEWEDIGVKAVNGSVSVNSIMVYSPQYFLQNWIEEETFAEAVDSAYDEEIDQWYALNPTIAALYLSSSVLNSSIQQTGGGGLLWNP